MIRIGILGCARIAPMALIRPARKITEVEVAGVASRDPERARRWARRHRLPRPYASYEDLVTDPGIDAVYIPLPNALHAQWAIRALEAGKHVLCEKPLASNEREARRMADAARASGLVAMEAFHYRYHPLAQRVEAIVRSGELGELRRVEAEMHVPILLPGDIRWNPELAGGAVMDVGCYTVNLVRFLAGSEPEVLTASGSLTRRGVDRSFEATLGLHRGVEGVVRGSILGPPKARLEVRGTRGVLSVFNPIAPQFFYRMRVRVDGNERREQVSGGTTYAHQLTAFAAAVRDGAPVPTDFDDAARNMRVLDRIRSIVGARFGWEESGAKPRRPWTQKEAG